MTLRSMLRRIPDELASLPRDLLLLYMPLWWISEIYAVSRSKTDPALGVSCRVRRLGAGKDRPGHALAPMCRTWTTRGPITRDLTTTAH
jgi:hypothetical protein